jgi:hypothetical protein
MTSRCFQSQDEAFSGPPLVSPNAPLRLLCLLAGEEPFDWDLIPPAGQEHSMDFGRLPDLHAGLRKRDIRPCYALDYVAAGAATPEVRAWFERGEALLGAHLHPWVNPPFGSADQENSFGANLPPDLEESKLAALVELLRRSFGQSPVLYQAGRYGIGPSTPQMLERLGLRVDASVSPGFDYSGEGGPDFSRFDGRPRWYRNSRLLSVPVSGGFMGLLRGLGPGLQNLMERPVARALRLPACLDRLRLCGRLRLSPEGNSLADLKRLTEALVRRGERVFTFYLHSSSLVAGATGYARDAAGVEAMIQRSLDYVDWFMDSLGGRPSDHLEVLRWAESEPGPDASPDHARHMRAKAGSSLGSGR